MNKKILIFISVFFAYNILIAMDFGALHRQIQKEIEEEQVPAGQVILVSKEGSEFELPKIVAEQSLTIEKMIGEIGADRKIFLSTISDQTLEEIVNLLKALHKYPDLTDKALLDALEQDVTIKDPFVLLAAANYLDIQPIIELAARAIARQEMNKRKGRFYTIEYGPLSQETHKKLFTLFGSSKKDILYLIARYFFLLYGKNFGDIPFDAYHYSIQDYLDYSPEKTKMGIRSFIIDHGVDNELRVLLSNNINNLKGLNSIPGIKEAKRLNIYYAPSIAEIPESIFADLDNLEAVEISKSNLQAIPVNALKHLRNLKTLDLNSNKIKEIPNNIAELKGLQRLYLYDNQIQMIPDSILLLTNLTLINLNNNKITVIPKGIATLKNLITIDLSNNKITHIDQETINAIAQLPSLQVLNLLYNPLDDRTKKALTDALGRKAFF